MRRPPSPAALRSWARRADAGRLRARLPGLALWLLLCVPPLCTLDDPSGPRRWATLAGFPLLALAVLVRRRAPLVAVAVPVVPSLVLSVQLFTGAYALALAVLGYLAGVRPARARPALWFFTGLALAGVPVCALVARTLWPWFTFLLALLLNVVLPWLLGRYRRQYGELVRTGWRLADRMEREQQAVADRTRLRERARIAGDMHDSLGHELALIALRAGALELDPGLDADRRAAAGELRAAAGAAAERLREIIGVLRTDNKGAPRRPADGSVAGLVARARASGMTVTLEQPGGDAAGLPGMTGPAVHRLVQEALTNAAKHAPGAAVRVRIERAEGQLRVTVTNAAPPPGPAPAAVSGGSGLVGLDERVRLAGGALHTGPAPDGGFTVTAHLPLAGGPLTGSDAAPQPTAAARELDRARRQVRRRLRQTVAVPLAVTAALLVLMGAFALVSTDWTVLDRAHYDRLRPGMPRTQVAGLVPFFRLDEPPAGTPAPPRGWSCAYYGVDADTDAAYELCFADGRLVRKAVVHRRDR
ncbi:two-component sensor histidine kinase [Streptomyces nigrescens]|uniref:histidine kinase n=1 Tax=Streptomyces nigrescens TaxID=1920 RepID=A0ABM8A0K9_STRNI|nr:histidine kinase [Streptomyces nigrescens]BDM72154.1 two-component sensor histidine kinase [Streptomyces nigrescens]